MIQFKEINGQLCLMLEKPIPLCASIKYPYVISGKKTKHPSIVTQDMDALLRIFIIAYSDEFEVIGYPVADHSAEWALYRMMQGDVVYQKYHFKRHYKNGNVHWFDRDGIERRLSVETWLRNFDESTGWQIYSEPKPMLADAKVGDLCQRSNGRYTQFHSKHKLKNGSIAYYFTDASGSTDIDGNHCIHECGNNIVSCEPLATEGTAEWALQMMKLGKDVCHKGHEPAYYHICNDGKEIACSLKNERRLTCGHLLVSKWGETGNDWQLYEPKPEPEPPREPEYVICKRCAGSQSVPNPVVSNTAYTTCSKCGGTGYEIKPEPAKEQFEVGDWVECVAKQVQRKLVDYLGGMGCYKTNYGEVISPCEILRKLSPSDVVVDFGSFSGTIELNSHPFRKQITVKNTQGDAIAYINIDYLDTPTRELVQELIKKQQGDAK